MLGAYFASTVAACRTARRLPSVWVLTSITAVVTWTSYAFYLLLYTNYSSVSLTVGNASPRYASTYYNVYLIWFLMGALILFADRIVRLDGEERIAETLHSRPVSNVVLLGGKLTALLLVAWLPLVFVISTIQAFGALGSTFGWPNLAFSSVSWIGVLFVDALPAFVFWTSLVVALAVSCRSRFAFHATAFVLLSVLVVTDNVRSQLPVAGRLSCLDLRRLVIRSGATLAGREGSRTSVRVARLRRGLPRFGRGDLCAQGRHRPGRPCPDGSRTDSPCDRPDRRSDQLMLRRCRRQATAGGKPMAVRRCRPMATKATKCPTW